MKQLMKLAALVFMLAASHCSFSQTSTDDYLFTIETPMYVCDLLGNKLSNEVYISPKFSKFTKIRKAGADSIVISFWQYQTDSVKYNKFNIDTTNPNEQRFFLISAEDFNNNSQEYYHRKPTFTAGTVIIPIKIRFNQFDFSKDVTLGTTVGVRQRMSPYSNNFANLLLGFGVSSVSLDSISTRGTVMQPTDRSALTASLGFVLEFNTVQVGIFTGLDYISNNEQTNWVYQGKPWLSIGFGYSILSRQSSGVPNGQQTQ